MKITKKFTIHTRIIKIILIGLCLNFSTAIRGTQSSLKFSPNEFLILHLLYRLAIYKISEQTISNNPPDIILETTSTPPLADETLTTNAIDHNGESPLHHAIRNNNYELTRQLLQNHANPNLENNIGWTPLHIAASNNNTKLIALLLEYNANPHAANATIETTIGPVLQTYTIVCKNFTPLHIAMLFRRHDASTLLLNTRLAAFNNNQNFIITTELQHQSDDYYQKLQKIAPQLRSHLLLYITLLELKHNYFEDLYFLKTQLLNQQISEELENFLNTFYHKI